jgi:hypothetical protein
MNLGKLGRTRHRVLEREREREREREGGREGEGGRERVLIFHFKNLCCQNLIMS